MKKQLLSQLKNYSKTITRIILRTTLYGNEHHKTGLSHKTGSKKILKSSIRSFVVPLYEFLE